MMVIFEIIRLYLAYIGNLGERVPELTGFWLLTLMIEIPLSTFLLAIVWIPIGSSTNPLQIVYLLPLQFSLQIIHTIFVYLEVIFGFFALRVLARYQISRFHYKQFDKGFQPNNNEEDDQDNDGIVKEKDVDWLDGLKNDYYSMKTINPDLKVTYEYIFFSVFKYI
jgi:transmembrane protein 17